MGTWKLIEYWPIYWTRHRNTNNGSMVFPTLCRSAFPLAQCACTPKPEMGTPHTSRIDWQQTQFSFLRFLVFLAEIELSFCTLWKLQGDMRIRISWVGLETLTLKQVSFSDNFPSRPFCVHDALRESTKFYFQFHEHGQFIALFILSQKSTEIKISASLLTEINAFWGGPNEITQSAIKREHSLHI